MRARGGTCVMGQEVQVTPNDNFLRGHVSHTFRRKKTTNLYVSKHISADIYLEALLMAPGLPTPPGLPRLLPSGPDPVRALHTSAEKQQLKTWLA